MAALASATFVWVAGAYCAQRARRADDSGATDRDLHALTATTRIAPGEAEQREQPAGDAKHEQCLSHAASTATAATRRAATVEGALATHRAHRIAAALQAATTTARAVQPSRPVRR